jgi:hypothetical protein
VPELVTLLENSDWTIRAWAAGTLGRIGPDARAAEPDLIARLGDRDAHVRDAACGALPNVGATKEAMLPGVISLLRDDNAQVFATALRTAARLGVDEGVTVPALTDQLNQKDPRVRYQAAVALGGCAGRAQSAAPALLKAIYDSDKDVKNAAVKALAKIDPSFGPKLPPVPEPASDAATGTVSLEMQGPASIALDIYKAVTGVELVTQLQGPVPGQINLRATRPLSPAEAKAFLEKALLEQCGLVLERIDDKHVAVKMRH